MIDVKVIFSMPDRTFEQHNVTFSDEQVRSLLTARNLIVGAVQSVPPRYLNDVCPELNNPSAIMSISGGLQMGGEYGMMLITLDMFVMTLSAMVSGGGYMRGVLSYDAFSQNGSKM